MSAAVEGKNRPVATNFQFLKMLCSIGTSLLQCTCISEVILLGRACPKPCSSFVPLWGYFAACIASPVPWLFACFFLIPAYIVVRKRLQNEKQGAAQQAARA